MRIYTDVPRLRRLAAVSVLGVAALLLTACGDGPVYQPSEERDDVYDVDANGIPVLMTAHYIEVNKIYRISKFRSSVGHSRNDDFETCRSLKHYFEPKYEVDWAAVQVFAPVTGKIWFLGQESRGTKLSIQADSNRAFIFTIFHVTLAAPLVMGQQMQAGQLLGTHFSRATYSDIEVGAHTPTGWRLFSQFDVMPDSLFDSYQARGVGARSDMIIPKAARDADPLTCRGEQFLTYGALASWVVLN